MSSVRKSRLLSLAVLAGLAACFSGRDTRGADKDAGEKMRVYVGTYTDGKSKGIYLLELDLKSGALKSLGVAGKAVNPSFLAIHPSRRFLYAVNEVGDFKATRGGAVGAFAIDAGSGKLKLLNQQPSRGAGPCHVTVDKKGKNVLVANYGGG